MACTVLLADDLDHVRMVLRMRLELEDGYEIVAEAADGREAIAMASLHQPDVVILDNHMPVMSGLEALPHLRAAAPSARVVMFSSDTDAERRALAAGADAFVSKSDPIEACIDQVAVGCRVPS